MGAYREKAADLLVDGYDLHVHTAPSHFERIMDDYEYVGQLDSYRMAGAVVKLHFGETSQRVSLVNDHAGAKARLYGSITLDWGVGGLNARAVRSALLLGAKIVWMPTLHSQNSLDYFKGKNKKYHVDGPGIKLIDDKGKLLDSVNEILEEVKEFDAVVATGHIGFDECLALCRESTARGIKTVVTHPDSEREGKTADEQAMLADMGCFVEKAFGNVYKGFVTAEEWVRRMKAVGLEHCVLVTDFGQKDRYSPCEAMIDGIEIALENGLDDQGIDLIVRENPRYLLGL